MLSRRPSLDTSVAEMETLYDECLYAQSMPFELQMRRCPADFPTPMSTVARGNADTMRPITASACSISLSAENVWMVSLYGSNWSAGTAEGT